MCKGGEITVPFIVGVLAKSLLIPFSIYPQSQQQLNGDGRGNLINLPDEIISSSSWMHSGSDVDMATRGHGVFGI